MVDFFDYPRAGTKVLGPIATEQPHANLTEYTKSFEIKENTKCFKF